MRRILTVLVLAMVGSGCGDDLKKSGSNNTPANNTAANNTQTNNTQTNNTQTNNTQTNNTQTNNTTIVPVEGEVVLQVTQAVQVSVESFAVNLQMANGLDESIALSPSTFRLGVGGLELTSVNFGESTCPIDSLISAGASHQCVVVFDDVRGTPDRLIYAGAGDPVVATFSPVLCETCDGPYCVDLQTSTEHCGTCGNSLVEGQSCQNGLPGCENGWKNEEGFCIPDDGFTELRSNPLNSGESCFEVCEPDSVCFGILLRGECEDMSPFGGQEEVFPGGASLLL